jgi:hypothetical protein
MEMIEEWEVYSAEAQITTAAGVELRGRILQLFAPHPPGQAQESLPQEYVDYPSTGVMLSRPVTVMRGIGVRMRTPAMAATNIVQLSFSYRVVHHD